MKIVLAVALAAFSAQSAAQAPVERRYALAEHGFLVLKVPGDWRDQVGRMDALTPPTIAFVAPNGEPFQVLVTPLWSRQRTKPDSAAMKRNVVAAADKVRPQAVERSLAPVALKGARTSGWFFAATDRAPAPGEFRFLVQGMMGLEHLTVTFTVLTNEGRKAVPGQALAALRDARLEPPAARKGTGETVRLPERAALRALFDAGKFGELDAELSAVQAAYRRGAIGDDEAGRAFAGVKSRDPEARAQYDRWVAERPQSYAARLMRADYLVGLAYLARGKEYVAKTSGAQFRDMFKLLGSAVDDLAVAIKLDPYPVLAVTTLVEVSQALGEGSQAAGLVSTAIALDPGVYNVRHAYLASLRPEWGGSLEQMQAALEQWKPALDEAKWQRLQRMLDDAKWRTALAPAAQLFAEKRYPDAIALYTKALDVAPSARAFAMRGAAYAQLGQDDKAIADFDRALELDPYGECCSGTFSNRARSLLRTGKVEKGMADLVMAAENDDTWAVRELALVYAFGKYKQKAEPALAARWCERAARQGDGLAMYCIGSLYHAGQGVARDAAKAAKWFEGAAQRNVPDAQADLAYMLWTGQGVAQDKPRAIKWWKAAAKAGNKRAQEQLERQLSTVEYFNEVTLPAWMEKVGMRSI